MLSWYKLENMYFVTYQRNEYSEIQLIYKGESEHEQMKAVDDFIDDWG